jgi:hypothetical protein
MRKGVEKMADTPDRAIIKEMLEILERVGCMFWACEGPDKPEQPMKTCFICSEIRKVRKYLLTSSG